MSQAVEIKKNSFYSFVSILARNLANAVAMIIISNFYTKEVAGQFLTAILYGTIMIQLADFGLDLLLTTETARARDKAEDIFSKLLPIKLIFASVSVLVMAGIALFNGSMSGATRIMILIMSLYSAFSALNNFYTALFRGFESLIIDAKISLVGNSFIVVCVLLFSVWRISIIYIAVVFVASRLLNLLQAVYYSRRFLKGTKLRFSINDVKNVKKKVMDFGLNNLCGNIFSQYDSLILQNMCGEASFAVYQAAARIYQLPAILLDVLLNGFIPVLSRLYRSAKTKWNETGFILHKILVILALPILAVLYAFAEQIIRLLYFKQDFSGAINVLRLFGFLVLIKFITETAAYMLTTSGQQAKRMRIVVTMTFLSIPIYVFFIGKYGVVGSIIAHLISNGIVGLAYIALVFPKVKRWYIDRKTLITVLISLILMAVMWELKNVSMFIIIPLFTVVYSVIALKYTFNKEEKEYFMPNVEGFVKSLFGKKEKV